MIQYIADSIETVYQFVKLTYIYIHSHKNNRKYNKQMYQKQRQKIIQQYCMSPRCVKATSKDPNKPFYSPYTPTHTPTHQHNHHNSNTHQRSHPNNSALLNQKNISYLKTSQNRFGNETKTSQCKHTKITEKLDTRNAKQININTHVYVHVSTPTQAHTNAHSHQSNTYTKSHSQAHTQLEQYPDIVEPDTITQENKVKKENNMNKPYGQHRNSKKEVYSWKNYLNSDINVYYNKIKENQQSRMSEPVNNYHSHQSDTNLETNKNGFSDMKLTKNVYVNVIDNRRNKDIRVDVDANSYLDTYGGFVEDTNQDPRHENSSSTKYKYRALDRQNIRYKQHVRPLQYNTDYPSRAHIGDASPFQTSLSEKQRQERQEKQRIFIQTLRGYNKRLNKQDKNEQSSLNNNDRNKNSSNDVRAVQWKRENYNNKKIKTENNSPYICQTDHSYKKSSFDQADDTNQIVYSNNYINNRFSGVTPPQEQDDNNVNRLLSGSQNKGRNSHESYTRIREQQKKRQTYMNRQNNKTQIQRQSKQKVRPKHRKHKSNLEQHQQQYNQLYDQVKDQMSQNYGQLREQKIDEQGNGRRFSKNKNRSKNKIRHVDQKNYQNEEVDHQQFKKSNKPRREQAVNLTSPHDNDYNLHPEQANNSNGNDMSRCDSGNSMTRFKVSPTKTVSIRPNNNGNTQGNEYSSYRKRVVIIDAQTNTQPLEFQYHQSTYNPSSSTANQNTNSKYTSIRIEGRSDDKEQESEYHRKLKEEQRLYLLGAFMDHYADIHHRKI